MKNVKKIIAFCFVLVFICGIYSQSSYFLTEEAKSTNKIGVRSAQSGLAEQEFRRGVQAYYKGSYNDAILQFEKALSYLPSENLIIDWLGKAYYKAGLEGTALAQWQTVLDSGYGGLLLQNKMEIIRERRVNDNTYDSPIKYTESGSYTGKNGEKLIFSQPISVLPNSDGSMWILAYGTNELIRMDVNGFVYKRSNGPFNGFDRPLDLIRLNNGDLLISEFAGDRLSVFTNKGQFLKTFGSKGVGVGNMVGPQYLAQDENGNIYVTDFGNARVDVFDSEGNGLFFFGIKNSNFDGLKAPTGIAVDLGYVYVADAVTGAIYKFDVAGNYIGLLCRPKTFVRPESMKKWGKYLILCDKNKVFSVDIESGAVFENVSTGNAPSLVTCAVPDVNGNILVTDFKSNEVFVMAKMSELVGGLFVQIEKINSDSFPKVYLEVKVENRHRQSVVGLKDKNFFITENKSPVLDYKFESASYANDIADITLVIDRSLESKEYSEAIDTSVREIAKSMNNKGTLRIVSAGDLPIQEYSGEPSGAEKFSVSALKTPYSKTPVIDMAIRLAANGIINCEKKRAIIYIGTGSVSSNSFVKYGLSDLVTYLNNNSIILASVMVKEGAPAREIAFLCDNSAGKQYYVFRSQGLSDVITDIIDYPSGTYVLSYTSSLQTSFGQKYLPVEVETYIMNRSGRDETGYFAPLQ